MTSPDDDPIDLAAVRADDELVEDLRAGNVPNDEPLTRALGGWVKQARDGDR